MSEHQAGPIESNEAPDIEETDHSIAPFDVEQGNSASPEGGEGIDDANADTPHDKQTTAKKSGHTTRHVSQTTVLWISWAIMVAFNAYSELARLGGTTTGEISNREFAWFTPAGYVFAIWGVIYIALAVFLAVLPRERLPYLWNTGFNAVGMLFILSCLLNVSWLIVWHYGQFTASMVIIVAIAISVWLIYALLRRAGAGILAWAPISIYASWLAIATCANASYLAVHQYPNIESTVQATTTFFLLILLLGGAFAIRTRLNDWISPLVVIWAAIGIGVRLFTTSAPIGVIIIAMTAIGALLIYFPWQHYSIVPNTSANA
ncbi:TspO/MBR family protein [Bifidobacterium aquikefiri]|uniref:TspO/MBR family protein n=1 Tax=Bifidobacterium aquikefiri TaxID=1653207 RepID=UPI0039E90CB2